MPPRDSIALLPVGQGWEGRVQVAQRIAIESAFTGKLPPLAKHGRRYHLATQQRGRWPRAMFLIMTLRLAKIIDHHVQCSQKGIEVHQQRAPFPYDLDR